MDDGAPHQLRWLEVSLQGGEQANTPQRGKQLEYFSPAARLIRCVTEEEKPPAAWRAEKQSYFQWAA